MSREQRGLRFAFTAEAEVRVGGSPQTSRGCVTELSLRGCFVEVAGSFKEQDSLRVKLFREDESIDSPADVIYVRPDGIGILFVDSSPHFRTVLQKWFLAALDHQSEEVAAK